MPKKSQLLRLQRFSSNALWHFTGYRKTDADSFKRLLSILRSGLDTYEPAPEMKFFKRHQTAIRKLSCLCDIPFRDLAIHTARYGSFGIAFEKKSAVRNGFNPVFYVHKEHPMFHQVESALKQRSTDAALRNFLDLFAAYYKQADLKNSLERDVYADTRLSNNFYYEREWRSVRPWKFAPKNVLAVMLPDKFITSFQKQCPPEFRKIPVISTQLIEAL
jgi:hypothetical protein